jgi:hypothetical protein
LEEAYKLANQVDAHLARHPKSIYHNKEEELFGKLMEGKLRFNAKGKLVRSSLERSKQESYRFSSAANQPWGLQLSQKEIRNRFGEDGLKLVEDVDKQVDLIFGKYSSNRARRKAEGPVVTGIRHPLLKKTYFGTNSNTLPNPLHPLLEAELKSLNKGLKSGAIKGDPIDIARAGTAGQHSEIFALNQALFALQKQTGKALTQEIFGEFLLFNRSLGKKGGVPPRCFNCRYISAGVKVIGND